MMNNIIGSGNHNEGIILTTGNFLTDFLGKAEKQVCFSFRKISYPETDFMENRGEEFFEQKGTFSFHNIRYEKCRIVQWLYFIEFVL